MHVRLPAYPSVCVLLKGVCVAPVYYSLSLHTSPKCIQQQRKQQSAAVDSNSQQRYKSSLQASNSILLRFGLSHHLWSDRTTNCHGDDGDFCGLSRLQVCRASFLTHFPLFSFFTQPKKTTGTWHVHLIKPSTTTAQLFKVACLAHELFLYLLL